MCARVRARVVGTHSVVDGVVYDEILASRVQPRPLQHEVSVLQWLRRFHWKIRATLCLKRRTDKPFRLCWVSYGAGQVTPIGILHLVAWVFDTVFASEYVAWSLSDKQPATDVAKNLSTEPRQLKCLHQNQVETSQQMKSMMPFLPHYENKLPILCISHRSSLTQTHCSINCYFSQNNRWGNVRYSASGSKQTTINADSEALTFIFIITWQRNNPLSCWEKLLDIYICEWWTTKNAHVRSASLKRATHKAPSVPFSLFFTLDSFSVILLLAQCTHVKAVNTKDLNTFTERYWHLAIVLAFKFLPWMNALLQWTGQDKINEVWSTVNKKHQRKKLRMCHTSLTFSCSVSRLWNKTQLFTLYYWTQIGYWTSAQHEFSNHFHSVTHVKSLIWVP